MVYFNGNYSEYCEYREKKLIQNTAEEDIVQVKKKNTNNEYFENKEKIKRKNKINKLELEIEKIEIEIEALKLEMQSDGVCTDYEKLKELQDKINGFEQEIELKMLEWDELNSI